MPSPNVTLAAAQTYDAVQYIFFFPISLTIESIIIIIVIIIIMFTLEQATKVQWRNGCIALVFL